ncbi:aflatoxin regulatory protein-domain-containing protein [Aspergillus lucknowensis]|uniref:Aflatoxin regulatory protein-domain-containing protein n=1 Tax=Aspergillus lucknowensis TaxID=176173 RepID=A0ABR4LJE0_9EURO
MATLTSPDVPSATQPQVVKLRGSCHACALSKLKCSQDKPKCARCTKRGTECQYLASKRAGRKQGRRAGSLRNPSKPDQQLNFVDEENDQKDYMAASTQLIQYALQQDRNLDIYRGNHHQQRTPSYTESVPSLLSSAGPATSATTPLTFNHPELDTFLSSPVSLSLLDVPDIDYFAGAEVNFGDSNGFPDPTSFLKPDGHISTLDTNIPKPSFVLDPLVSLSDLPSPPTSTGRYSSGSPTQCSCFIRSLVLLRELFPDSAATCPSTSPSDGASAETLPIRKIITQNAETIKEINDILDCYCSHDCYTLTIITLTVLKVIAWYGAVARESPLGENRQARRENVDRTPVVIGGYQLEGEDQGRMAAQLVLSELHRVQRLVNTLSQRLKDQAERDGLTNLTTSGVNGTMGHDSVLPGRLSVQLAADLRTRLRGLSGEIVERLRRS